MKRLLAAVLSCFACALRGATYDISAVRIVKDTPTAGITCNGWVAEIDITQDGNSLPGLSTTNGDSCYSFGLGTNNNPIPNATVVFTVTSPGYDATGSATTIVRTVYGTKWLRHPYAASPPDATYSDETAAGGTLTVRISLSDFIYTGDTVTVAIAAGFYSQGGKSNNALTAGTSVTVNSTLTHPKCIGRWAWTGYERITTADFLVEFVAFHRSARNNQPLAACLISAIGQTSAVTVTKTITAMTKSARPVGAAGFGDANTVLVYAATFTSSDFASFTQGETVRFRAQCYPWVGNSGAVLDTEIGADGVAQPSESLGPLYALLDKTGAYGTPFAVIDGTNGHSSTANTWVYASQSAAEAAYASNNTNSYADIGFGTVAIKSYNNAHYGHNDPSGGTALLTAGTFALTAGYTGGTDSGTTTWFTVTRLSTVPRANAIIGTPDQGYVLSTYMKVTDVTIARSTTGVCLAGGAADVLWMDNNTLNVTGSAGMSSGWLALYGTRNIGATPGFVSSSHRASLIRGNSLSSATMQRPFAIIGNNGIYTTQEAHVAGIGDQDNIIYAFNTVFAGGSTSMVTIELLSIVKGAAIVQNVIEPSGASFVGTLLSVGGSDAITTSNMLFWYNSTAGQRWNVAYNATGSTYLLHTNWSQVGNIVPNWNNKADTFVPANAARVGGWSVRWSVGNYGNRIAGSGTTAYEPEVRGLYDNGAYTAVTGTDSKVYYVTASHTGSSYNKPITGGSYTSYWSQYGTLAGTWQTGIQYSSIGYTDDEGAATSASGNGNGNYHLLSSSTALNLIPSGKAVLPYDIEGKVRRNDGTGAAGAYEASLGSNFFLLFP